MSKEQSAMLVTAYGTDSEEDPALLRRVLGTRLRRLREAAGISGAGAGRAIGASPAKIGRMEAGRAGFRTMDVDDLLTLYGMDDAATRSEYLRLARRANALERWEIDAILTPPRQDTYLALEDAADMIRCYAPGLLPELTRTPSYAHAVFGIAHPEPAADAQRRIELLMRRQHLLTRTDPPRVWFVIEEAALRRRIGGTEVWRTQLEHLAALAARPNVTVQILPDHIGGPAISATPFTLLRFAAPELSDLVHLNQATATHILDKRGELDHYNAIWDRLCVCATPPDRTAKALEALANDPSPVTILAP